jgi:hypothetical protein
MAIAVGLGCTGTGSAEGRAVASDTRGGRLKKEHAIKENDSNISQPGLKFLINVFIGFQIFCFMQTHSQMTII